MRKIFTVTLAGLLAASLAACGGGGSQAVVPPSGGGPAATSAPSPTATSASYASPTFSIRIPTVAEAAAAISMPGKHPSFISTGVQSVVITLTADSIGIDPATITGNPATTSINSTNCGSGCTVAGPPSPVGNDTYTITTYLGAAGAGAALDTGTTTVDIAQGAANTNSLTLLGIPKTLILGGWASFSAGVPSSQILAGPTAGHDVVRVMDANGENITGTYAVPVTLSDADTNGDGSSLTTDACPSLYPTGNPVVAATQVVFTSDSSTANLCYGGIAENAFTVVASASGTSGTLRPATPALNQPAYVAFSGTPLDVVDDSGYPTNPVLVNLYGASGAGSSGTVQYSETGWTDAPYNQDLIVGTAPACTLAGPFSTYATTASSHVTGATQFVMTSIASPVAGACPVAINDGLTNPSKKTAYINSSYTTSSLGINSTKRKH